MKVIKRNGTEVEFNPTKIYYAIERANKSIPEEDRIKHGQIAAIATAVQLECQQLNREPTVEDIQDKVEAHLIRLGAVQLAKHYITYRYTRSLVRKSNTTDERILSLIECCNEEAKQENANKNPYIKNNKSKLLILKYIY